jgi:choline-glycine betaine transporter
MSDYHQFYLYWWFAWSIMIGQFVSRFVGGLKAWQLLLALLVVPSIPIAVWFSVLYYDFTNGIEIGEYTRLAMVFVGVVFVVNSLDSLTRLYTQNIGFTPAKAGTPLYVAGNWLLLMALILLFRFTPLQIEWIGLAVVAIYAAIYSLVFGRRRKLYGSMPGR